MSRRNRPHGTLHRLRAGRPPAAELARLRGSFLAWLIDHGMPAGTDTDALWDDTVFVVELASERVGLTDPRTWTADQVTALAAAADDDAAADALPALPLLLAFLGDTGRWAGGAEEFERALQAAEEATSPMAAVLAELAEVSVDPADEEAALRALPLVAQAEELLRFIHPRRALTSTGALRRADVVAAAALVGLDLDGRSPRSMWDLPRLASLWEAARNADLLVVSPAQVTLGPPAHGWLSGDAEQRAQARRRLVAGYLTDVLAAPSPAPWLPHPVLALLPALAAAALGRPIPTANLLHPAGVPDELPPDIAGAAALLSLAAMPAHAILDRLADDGLLRVDDVVAVPPGLRGVLASVVSDLLRTAPGTGGAPDIAPPDPALAGQAYRLRIELEGAQPPVWREVLVDPNLPLDEVHDLVQAVFDWDDSHPHDFATVGTRGRTRRFAPPEVVDALGPVADPPQDEGATRLAELVGPRRGRLRYQYDFGDGWDHLITVVGSEPAEGMALPRCVAGAGAAPLEDSGGVWGWNEMVQAANDPRHPRHRDAREWLDLSRGEVFDPARFDPADADRRLRHLRTSARQHR